MKRFTLKAAALVFAAFLIVIFSSCPNPNNHEIKKPEDIVPPPPPEQNQESDDATLAKFYINGNEITIGTAAASMSLAEPVNFSITDTEAQAGVTVTAYSSSEKAAAAYGKQAGGGGAIAWKTAGNVTFSEGDFLIVRVTAENGDRLYYRFVPVIEATPIVVPSLLGKVLILHAYGTGNNTDGGISHSFVELYNNGDDAADLSGYSLQYSAGGTAWKVLQLSGTIPAKSSFLVLGKKNNPDGRLQLIEADADMVWQDSGSQLEMSNKAFKVFLVKSTIAVKAANPFNTDGTGKKASGYVDFLGTGANDESAHIDAYETAEPMLLSKGKSARRATLVDTDDNQRDFESLEWRLGQNKALNESEAAALRPRSSKDGPWNPEYYITLSGSVTLDINSIIRQKKILVEAWGSPDATEGSLAARCEAGVQAKTWIMRAPPGQELWFKVTVTDETGYTFGKVVSASGRTFTSGEAGISLTLGGYVAPELTAFTLLDATGSTSGTFTKQNKTGTINNTANTIAFADTAYTTVTPAAIIDFHKLAANFTLSAGAKLYAGNTEQVSGVTTNNYYQPVTLTVVAEDNARKTYNVAGMSLPNGSTSGRVVGTRNFQTEGFGVLNITTTDTTLGLPTGTSGIGKLNIVWNPTGTFTYYGPTGRVITGGTEIKAHGNYSVRHDSLKSYSLKLNEKAGFDYYDYKTQSYITLPAHKRWTLLAHPYDANNGSSTNAGSRMKTAVGLEMGRQVLTNMGWQPHIEWVFFFLNGTFKGAYILAETIKIDEGRLNITPEASASHPDGGWIAEMNNAWWYANDSMGGTSQYIFDSLYNFMTSHQSPVTNRTQHVGTSGQVRQQGVVWSFSSPDSNLGWYEPDPPLGNGNLSTSNYALNNAYQPRKGIILAAKLGTGTAYNRASASPSQWIVPNDFSNTTNGMGTANMLVTGTYGQNNGGVAGTRTLTLVYPEWETSVFVKMAKFIQDAEDAIYSHDYLTNPGGRGSYHDYIDIDSFIDWEIAMEMCSNWELVALNGEYMYYDPSIGKLKMGLIWDLDQGWNGNNGADPGFIRKIPFWYKELLGYELTNVTGGTAFVGNDKPADRKDPFYVQRLKARWAEVKGRFNTELDPFMDAQLVRFTRISDYSATGINLDRTTALKSSISNRVASLNTEFNNY